MTKLKENAFGKKLAFDVRETILSIFYDVTPYKQDNVLEQDREYRSTAHNYERDAWEWEKHVNIHYQGRLLAAAQVNPKKHIYLYEQFDKHRYPMKIFERTVSQYFPTIKLEIKQGE